jgi:hypothetical protein
VLFGLADALINPQRLLYSLQRKHNGTLPDLHLQFVRDPQAQIARAVGKVC